MTPTEAQTKAEAMARECAGELLSDHVMFTINRSRGDRMAEMIAKKLNLPSLLRAEAELGDYKTAYSKRVAEINELLRVSDQLRAELANERKRIKELEQHIERLTHGPCGAREQ